jgi:hypothetical protein
MKARWHCFRIALVLCCISALAQSRGNFPNPPPPLAPIPAPNRTTTKVKHLDAVQLQREARELSDLAQSVPADVDSVNRGLLPKDLAEKLKRIEKLSKHLRGEISQ